MKARILAPTTENIALAAQALKAGEVVGMPTETVYGLAGCAFSEQALARIFGTKERPTFDPLIVHVALPEKQSGILRQLEALELIELSSFSESARNTAENLLQAFSPGPFTLVLPKNPRVPDLATSGLPTVAIRIPRHPVAQALIHEAGFPLAAPSANRFGRISPTNAQAVQEELGERISWILDGGLCDVGVESTVAAISPEGYVSLLRPGGIPKSDLEKAAGKPLSAIRQPAPAGQFQAPGLLESHYAPEKKLHLLPKRVMEMSREDFENLGLAAGTESLGVLLFSTDPNSAAAHLVRTLNVNVTVRRLTRTGDLAEAARALFIELRALDHLPVQALIAEPCPSEQGLGHAISDRLRRASARLSH